MTKKVLTYGKDAVQLVVGIAMSAFAMACFALPYDMVVSGTSGIGRAFNAFFGWNITVVVGVVNITVFIVGALMIGKKFAGSIAVGTFLFPFFLELFQRIDALQHLVEDPLLAAICAGIIDGAGLGLVIRMGGSTGGIDVPPIIMNRKLGWKIAPMIYAIDAGIFLLQLPITASNGVILGLLYALIYSVVMDKILVMDNGGVQLQIYSDEWEAINEKLLKIGYGTTLIKAKGGYIRDDKFIVSSVIGSKKFGAVKRAVLKIDEKAFITISHVSEVNGNGFTVMFSDENYQPEISERNEGEL